MNPKKKKQMTFVPIKKDGNGSNGNQELLCVALTTLTSIIKAMGSIIDESVHTQIQCVLISLGMEQKFSKSVKSRQKLYEALFAILSEGHAKCQPNLHLFCQLFR